MKGTIEECIAHMQQTRLQSVLLRRHDCYEAVRLDSLAAQRIFDLGTESANEVIGVFTQRCPIEVIYHEAGEPVPVQGER